jgi:hypothetical protein
LIKFAKIVRQVGILVETAEVALVANIVAWIETDEARKEPPIGLGLAVAAQITLLRKPFLQTVQRLEQEPEGAVVSFLRDRVAAAIDGIVERPTNIAVHTRSSGELQDASSRVARQLARLVSSMPRRSARRASSVE